MALSTVELAYQLARAGAAEDLAALKRRLKAAGCRQVDVVLAPRGLREHLAAICAATFRSPPDASREALEPAEAS